MFCAAALTLLDAPSFLQTSEFRRRETSGHLYESKHQVVSVQCISSFLPLSDCFCSSNARGEPPASCACSETPFRLLRILTRNWTFNSRVCVRVRVPTQFSVSLAAAVCPRHLGRVDRLQHSGRSADFLPIPPRQCVCAFV